MRASFKDSDLQDAFTADGFVVVDLFDADTAAALLAHVLEVSAGAFEPSEIGGNRLTYYASVIDSDFEVRRRLFRLLAPAMTDAADRLLDRHRLVTAGIVAKKGGAGTLALHTDPTLTTDPDIASLTLWCPLVDVEEANGRLHVIPGSHKVSRQINGPGIPEYYWRYRDRIARHATALSLKAGQAVIFDGRLIHGSPPNTTERVRAAIMASFVPEEAQALLFTPDPDSAGARLLMFDVGNGRYFEHDAADFVSGRVAEAHVGAIANPNAPVTVEEFERRLADLRRPAAVPAPRPGFLARLAGRR
ncbi:phytanoyl-CoA dioxygenase family protein [Sphingosinicella sp. BN140058]|uniref:phytanoyl-CoA dioxygenase family protein n=1 Tax=Sphingosinicella sp. BN140058 TaxID=1892855 RepID=UPI001010DF0B|nr:phytanoyl-CoA dioxygenase family protein [Sphingosinicella sp. BN140058]QAY75109.1 hypothetical protein ETR14_00110 [Sphingosinicella sp. BN140058]